MMKLKVESTDLSKRLDVFVAEKLPEISRAFVGKLSEQGKVLVNGEGQRLSYKLKIGDKVDVDYATNELNLIPDIDLPVLYEDNDCVVINKPTGLLTHSKGAFNPEATVATWLSHRQSADRRQQTTNQHSQREGIVHRLDRGTSGVMILAKTPEALSWLQKQFSTRKVKKTYIAIITGELNPPEAIIDMPIERNPRHPQTFRVGSQGKPAKTHYRVLEVANKEDSKLSLLELKPETGRTHQLRVHLKQLGHPIVGDTFYDGQTANRLFLHALNLELTLPTHERKVFTAVLPKEFKDYMDNSE